MRRTPKRTHRRYRGSGQVLHLDGVYRKPRNVLLLAARNADGRYWFIWTAHSGKLAWSVRIKETIDQAFRGEIRLELEPEDP